MTEPTCPVCGGASLRPSVSPPEIVVLRCTGCGHRVARHGDGTDAGVDYHAQYDEGLLEALRATRVRQSVQLIRLLERRVPHLSKIVDYGAGRGWFLEACRNARISPIAGVDTSQISVDGLAALGIEALRLAEDESGPAVLPRLSFRPRVLTLLDVVEHFPPERLQHRLRSIVEGCGDGLEFVAMKVPVAGTLYGAAAALSRAGAPGLLRQLYQGGTWPPHFNYFSRTSAERLLESAGLSIVERAGDPDFEPDFLGQRIGARGPVLQTLSRVAGDALAAVIQTSGRFDSLILLAVPARTREN